MTAFLAARVMIGSMLVTVVALSLAALAMTTSLAATVVTAFLAALAMTASLLALAMISSMVVQVPTRVTGQKTLIRALMLRLKSTVRLEKQ